MQINRRDYKCILCQISPMFQQTYYRILKYKIINNLSLCHFVRLIHITDVNNRNDSFCHKYKHTYLSSKYYSTQKQYNFDNIFLSTTI